MNMTKGKQRGSLQEKEEAERMITSINLLQQTMGSAQCVPIRTCFEKDWERKRSDCGNRKGIIKRALYNYKVKKKVYAKKKNLLKGRFQDIFYQNHT